MGSDAPSAGTLAGRRRTGGAADVLGLALDAVEEAAVVVLDRSGRVTRASAGVRALLGHEPDRLLGRHVSCLDPPRAVATGAAGDLLAAAETDGRVAVSAARLRADGSTLEADVAVTALRAVDGALHGFVQVIRPAGASAAGTSTPATRDELQERLERIAETAPGVIHQFRRSADGRLSFPYASPAFREVYGIDPADVTQDAQPFLTRIASDDARRLAVSLDRSAATMTLFREELRYAHPERGELWIEAASIPRPEADGGTVWHGFLRDVTERKRLELELERRRVQLEEAQRVGRVGSFEYDLRTGDVQWSDEHRRIFGWDPAAPLPVLLEEFLVCVHPFDRDVVRAAVRAGARDGKAFEFDYRIVRPDGTTAWIHERGVFELDEHGAPVRQRGTVQDVTARRSLEEQLRQSQKMEAIGRLAGGVAHDFNNLLTVISGHTELLLGVSELGERERASLDSIRQAGEHAASLTRRLLAFSRKQVLDVKTIDLDEVVVGLEPMLTRLVAEDVVLELLPGAGMQVRADVGQVEQVLFNLVVNASDAMPHGGQITIATGVVDVPPGVTAVDEDVAPGSYVELTVTDTGTGMHPDVVERVFEPFFTTKEPGKGTGLGLSMVYGIVRQSGGHVTVHSTPGHGTLMRILLPPAAASAEGAVREPAPVGRPASGSGTVLLVEDDVAVRRLGADALARLGYRVLQAGNGLEALHVAAATQGSIDLLLTDVVMPQMGGVELARELRRRRPETRILLMSGYASDVDRADLAGAGDGFLAKPFTTEGLARLVGATLAA